MKTLTALTIALLAASCAPKAIIVRSISEQAAVARGAVQAVSVKADAVDHTAAVVGNHVRDLQTSIAASQTEAEHLREIGKATQRELDRNAAAWESAKQRAKQLEDTAASLQFDVAGLQTAVESAKVESDKSLKMAHDSDATVIKLQNRIVDMTPDYEFGKEIRHAVWWIIGLTIAAFLGVIALVIFNRAARAAAAVASHGIIT